MARPLITANTLTVMRLVLIPLPAYLLYTNTTGQWIAVILGTLLGITDAVDGILARKYGPTVLGALLDPIADKVFLAATYTPLADLGIVPPWAIALLFVREFLITSLRSVFERRHLRLETSYVAKVKTWIQMIGLVLFVFVGVLREEHSPLLVMAALVAIGATAIVVLLLRRSRHVWVAVVLTAWVVAVALGERFSGIAASVPVIVALILGVTWWSGLEYIGGGVRLLRGARPLDAGDLVRLVGSLLPVLAVVVLARTHLMWQVALLLSIELAHGGLDNLLSHHKADLSPLTWGARIAAIAAALGVAIAQPALAPAALAVALAISVVGAALAFWVRRSIYLSDAVLDEQLKMKVLVTGANGFVGSNLVRHLVDAGHHVRAMMQPGTPPGPVEGVAHELAWADLRSREALRAATVGIEGVVHLAAMLGDYGPPELYTQINVDGTRRLLDLAVDAGARRFVLMSSLAVHRWRGHPDGDEDTAADNDSMPYGSTKRRGEGSLREAHAEGRIETVSVRPGVFLYGPNDVRHFAPLARGIERGLMPVVDGGRARLCTAYVENLALGVRLCLESPAAAGRTYVIVDGSPLTWRDLFNRIADHLGVRRPRIDLPARLVLPNARALERVVPLANADRNPGLTEYRVRLLSTDIVFRIDRARRELGYEPAFTVDEGIRRSVAWYRGSR